MARHSLIPDSTFYICYLDDIKKPDILARFIENDRLCFFTGQIICNEIMKSRNYAIIKDNFNKKITMFDYYNYGEILRPLFSQEEIKKGEHEVIVISFIMNTENNDFTAILDDSAPRKFLEINFPKIAKFVEGTVGFTKSCYLKYNILTKEETLIILKLIQKSKFRIEDDIINNAIYEVGCS